MNRVFIGGSRHVSRLPAQVKQRLENVISSGHHVLVGDANGADKAVQKYLVDASYGSVTVFCSGKTARNNLGQWPTHKVALSENIKGFQFYAAKDREMAREADFGLMIWDGKSTGTILNVLRLVRGGKKAVLLNVPDRQATTFKTSADWDDFISQCSHRLLNELRERATPEEWRPDRQTSLLDLADETAGQPRNPAPSVRAAGKLVADINAALKSGDSDSVLKALGSIAKARGMSHVAKDAGLARESLYRSLNTGGNPEFATVLKVMASVGLRLIVHAEEPLADRAGERDVAIRLD
jgi:probable addiction module antidote protein